jgi:hypothetical protein
MLCRFRFRKMAQGFLVSPLPSSHVWISAATPVLFLSIIIMCELPEMPALRQASLLDCVT